jgi:hypothetical protein
MAARGGFRNCKRWRTSSQDSKIVDPEIAKTGGEEDYRFVTITLRSAALTGEMFRAFPLFFLHDLSNLSCVI